MFHSDTIQKKCFGSDFKGCLMEHSDAV